MATCTTAILHRSRNILEQNRDDILVHEINTNNVSVLWNYDKYQTGIATCTTAVKMY